MSGRDEWRLMALSNLHCEDPLCGISLDMAAWGRPNRNILKISAPGYEPPIYEVVCPKSLDTGYYCPFGVTVVFVPISVDDPIEIGTQAVLEHLSSVCDSCGHKLDWDKAHRQWQKSHPNERSKIRLRIDCPLNWKEIWSGWRGKKFIRHAQVRVIWILGEGEDGGIPDKLPDEIAPLRDQDAA